MEIEKRINELRDILFRRVSLNKRLEETDSQLIYLKDKKRELFKILENDGVNIRQVESDSIINLWYEMFTSKGKNVQKITHDYKLISDLYEFIQKEHSDLKNKLNNFPELQAEYDKLIKEKETLLLESEKSKYEKVKNLDEEIIKYKNHIRDLNEAIISGNSLNNSLTYLIDLINKAKNWETIDIFGRSLFLSLTNTDLFRASAEKIKNLHYLANKFSRELQIICFYMNIKIDIQPFNRFSDYFLNELYYDISSKEKIVHTIHKINEMHISVNNVLQILAKFKGEYIEEVLKIENEKQLLIS